MVRAEEIGAGSKTTAVASADPHVHDHEVCEFENLNFRRRPMD